MKYISLLFFIALTLILSGCFSRSEIAVTQSGWQVSWQEDVNEQEVEEIIDNEEIEEENIEDVDVKEEVWEDQVSNNEDNNTQITQVETQASASGELDAYDIDSFEADLDQQIDDIFNAMGIDE